MRCLTNRAGNNDRRSPHPMTILERLQDRIVDFTLHEDKRGINLDECCDHYFRVELSKEEFGQMIAELQALHDQML
jgi:uncharacterized Fe-S cluster-containing MiaB family protein